MEQLENAPHVLLRRLVTRIDRDRTPITFFCLIIVFAHLEQDAEKIVRFDHAIILLDHFSQVLSREIEITIVERAFRGE